MTNTKLYLYRTLSDVKLYRPDSVDIVRLLGVQLELSGDDELDRPVDVDIVRLVDVQLELSVDFEPDRPVCTELSLPLARSHLTD